MEGERKEGKKGGRKTGREGYGMFIKIKIKRESSLLIL